MGIQQSARRLSGPQLARLLTPAPTDRPVYAALARAIRGLVLDGRIPLRVRLPAERDLATALGLSRTTVTTAYDTLRAEGFVESRQGAGSWTTLPPAGLPAPGAPAPGHSGAAHSWLAPDTIDLGCAAPNAPEALDAAVTAAVTELPRYAAGPGYEVAGLVTLREAIAERYTARGLPTRPDQIVVTGGAQHALALLLQTLAEPGDAVLVERPTYPHALEATRRRGCRLIPVGVNEGWDVELIASSLRQAAVRLAYVVPDFQNPTGQLMGDADRAALVTAAHQADAFLIADETFAELAIDDLSGNRPLAAFEPGGSGGRVISVGSVSKLVWGGLRIGWIRTTPPLARRLVLARGAVDIASSVLDQLIVQELLRRIEDVRAERADELRARRDALISALREQLPDWAFTIPTGGMSLWARLPAPIATSLADAATRHGVRIVPGPVFGVDGVLEDYVRLPYVLPPEVLREAVTRLAAAFRTVSAAPPPRHLPAYV